MKISICIPTYSNPSSLKRLLDSIKLQNFKDYEVIITDDSPDDSVKEVVAQYQGYNIRYYKNPRSLGSPMNWNAAIEKAESDYIKIMHHDDYFTSPFSLQKIVNALQKYSFVFVQSNHVINNKIISMHNPSVETVHNYIANPIKLLLENVIGAPSAVAYKKNALVYDKRLKWFVDVEFYVRYLHSISREDMCYIEEPLVNIGVDIGRVSNDCINNTDLVHSEFFYSLIKGYEMGIYNLKNISVYFCKFLKINNIRNFLEIRISIPIKYRCFFCLLYYIFWMKNVCS